MNYEWLNLKASYAFYEHCLYHYGDRIGHGIRLATDEEVAVFCMGGEL